MRRDAALTVTSLLGVVLMTFHLTEDLLHGAMAPSGMVWSILILFLWVSGTVVLAGRRTGHVIMLIGSLLAAAMPVIHMGGAGPARHGFFFVWVLVALGVTGVLGALLAARALAGRGLAAPAADA